MYTIISVRQISLNYKCINFLIPKAPLSSNHPITQNSSCQIIQTQAYIDQVFLYLAIHLSFG